MRLATPDDAFEIAEIDMISFDNSFNERTLRTEIELGAGGCWVYGDPITGFVLTRRDDDITDITRIAVHPDAKGKGVGRTLLQQAIASTPGPHLLTVRKANTVALRLYLKHGFVIEAELPDVPAWVMRRDE